MKTAFVLSSLMAGGALAPSACAPMGRNDPAPNPRSDTAF